MTLWTAQLCTVGKEVGQGYVLVAHHDQSHFVEISWNYILHTVKTQENILSVSKVAANCSIGQRVFNDLCLTPVFIKFGCLIQKMFFYFILVSEISLLVEKLAKDFKKKNAIDGEDSRSFSKATLVFHKILCKLV